MSLDAPMHPEAASPTIEHDTIEHDSSNGGGLGSPGPLFAAGDTEEDKKDAGASSDEHFLHPLDRGIVIK